MLLPSLTGEEALNVAVGATLLIVTLAVYSVTPPSLSLILPFTVREPLSLVEHVADLVPVKAPYPEPQSNAYVTPAVVSTDDGSGAPVSDRLILPPSLTGDGALNVAVGATLLTVNENVVVTTCPFPSLAVIVTVCDWLGPSVVPNDQLQVPLFVPVFVTAPTDAVIVTLSPESESEYVPVFVAVAPSLTVRDALSAATVGAEFAVAAYVAR